METMYIGLAAYGVFTLFIIALTYLSWGGFGENEEDDIELEEDENEEETGDSDYPGDGVYHLCGSYEHHYEDTPLSDALIVGQVYRKILAIRQKSCLKADSYNYLVWLTWQEDNAICGYDELITLPEDPPEYFVYTVNGKIVEVSDGRYKSTGSNQESGNAPVQRGRTSTEAPVRTAPACQVRH